MEQAEPSEPVVLGGRYRLLRKLVEGGMGQVWYAEHLTLHSPVAVKLITADGENSEESLQRFLLEARAGAALRSPHVVQIFDYGLHEGLPYIVMELLAGESLADCLDRRGALDVWTTERIICQVARALTRAHAAGVIHRDLKPENIFLVDDDDDILVKLLDFGIAKSSIHSFTSSIVAQTTRTGTFIGTPRYSSPEQIEGVKTLDHRTDIWSLGVVAFECLLGEPPFDGDAIGKIMVEICSQPAPLPSARGPAPAGFDAWFACACARDPEQRFQSAREAAEELSRICADVPSPPGMRWPRPAQLRLRRRPRRSPTALGARATVRAAVFAGISLASVAAFIAFRDARHTPSDAPDVAVMPARPTEAAPSEAAEPAPAIARDTKREAVTRATSNSSVAAPKAASADPSSSVQGERSSNSRMSLQRTSASRPEPAERRPSPANTKDPERERAPEQTPRPSPAEPERINLGI